MGFAWVDRNKFQRPWVGCVAVRGGPAGESRNAMHGPTTMAGMSYSVDGRARLIVPLLADYIEACRTVGQAGCYW